MCLQSLAMSEEANDFHLVRGMPEKVVASEIGDKLVVAEVTHYLKQCSSCREKKCKIL